MPPLLPNNAGRGQRAGDGGESWQTKLKRQGAPKHQIVGWDGTWQCKCGVRHSMLSRCQDCRTQAPCRDYLRGACPSAQICRFPHPPFQLPTAAPPASMTAKGQTPAVDPEAVQRAARAAQQGERELRTISWAGDWACPCGEDNLFRDPTCRRCRGTAPCREWVRGRCSAPSCRFPHAPFDLPRNKPERMEKNNDLVVVKLTPASVMYRPPAPSAPAAAGTGPANGGAAAGAAAGGANGGGAAGAGARTVEVWPQRAAEAAQPRVVPNAWGQPLNAAKRVAAAAEPAPAPAAAATAGAGAAASTVGGGGSGGAGGGAAAAAAPVTSAWQGRPQGAATTVGAGAAGQGQGQPAAGGWAAPQEPQQGGETSQQALAPVEEAPSWHPFQSKTIAPLQQQQHGALPGLGAAVPGVGWLGWQPHQADAGLGLGPVSDGGAGLSAPGLSSLGSLSSLCSGTAALSLGGSVQGGSLSGGGTDVVSRVGSWDAASRGLQGYCVVDQPLLHGSQATMLLNIPDGRQQQS